MEEKKCFVGQDWGRGSMGTQGDLPQLVMVLRVQPAWCIPVLSPKRGAKLLKARTGRLGKWRGVGSPKDPPGASHLPRSLGKQKDFPLALCPHSSTGVCW